MSQPPSPSPPPVVVLGAKPTILGDLHHRFLRAPWWLALGGVVAFFLGTNALFAALYAAVGGLGGKDHPSALDYFSFSVHTMATIGYGTMYPASAAAQALVVAEAIAGILTTAVVTGLVFSKFSQTSGKVVFSRQATVAPLDGVPTLSFRLGNMRGNQIVEAQLRVTLVRTERTREGVTLYRMYDLPLVRERSPAFSRSWTAMHVIGPGSLLAGKSPADLAREEVELIVSLVGTDDTSLQPVHARHTYAHDEVIWGARHADVLSERADGQLVLDLTKFHDVVPTAPTETFPFPQGGDG